MSDFFVVRQPVYLASEELAGYEIRFRDTGDGTDALSQSLVTGTFDIVRDGIPAYISCTRAQLLSPAFELLNPKVTALLLPPDLAPDGEVIPRLMSFRSGGGTIVLDGLEPHVTPNESFGALATWARIDVRQDDLVEIGRICDRVAAGGKRKLMAAWIAEQTQLDTAHQLGFEALQGELFSRPEPLPTAELPASTVAAIRLLALARQEEISDNRLEDAIAIDPVLTFQLLRLVNSAAVGARGVTSIGQALRLTGRNAFQRWLSVAIAASRKSRTGADVQLIRQAIERARFMEQFAGGNRDSGTLFLAGLFSLMDAVFRMPLPDVLARVSLSAEVNDALLERSGPYAPALEIAESYELGLFENAAEIASRESIDAAGLGRMYTDALSWAQEALSSLAPAQKAAA